MEKELYKIYSEKWGNLNKEILEIYKNSDLKIKPTNPLLISLENNDYQNSEIKVMIFGQETNSWYETYNGNINKTLNFYRDFFNKGEALNNYSGAFWNGVNRFLDLLGNKYPNKKIGLLWNNVIKIGCEERNKNMPPEYIYKIEKENFNLIKKEIEILKPNIILFLSGPYYDFAIENAFGTSYKKSQIKEFSERQLSKIDIGFGENIFRTYHPNYLWRNNINKYFNAIINQINL